MRQPLAVVTTLLGGCSFIYNPDHINKDIDALRVDVETVADVDPTMLKLDYAFPGTVYEGMGVGNSRPAVVVVRGEQIAPNATVTVVPAQGDPSQITVNGITIADDHNWIAISLTAPVDLNQDEFGPKAKSPVPLVITVDNGGGVMMSLPTAVGLKFLDQLITPITAPVDPMKRYSMIDVAALDALPVGIGRVTLHSMSSITFHNGITLAAAGSSAGPGGCNGAGSGGTPGATASNVDNAACNSGAGAASMSPGTPGGYGGDPQMSDFTLATPGGGGGGGLTLALAGGGPGGGGAGMLSLEAAGDLTITKNTTTNVAIDAKGGMGGGGALGLGAGGGGGAGGTVLLRSGGTLMVGSVVVDGGSGGTSGGVTGITGTAGHVRFDAAHGSAPLGYIGPMFLGVPYFSAVRTVITGITLTGAPSDTSAIGVAYDKDLDAPVDGRFIMNFNAVGIATPSINLSPGYNLLCASVQDGNALQHEESGNCAEIAYLPGAN